MNMKKPKSLVLTLGLVLVAASWGCATTSAVDKKIAASQAAADKKIESVETQVEELQEKQKATETKVNAQGQELEKLSQTAQDALKRAQEAGVIAKGNVVMQESFSEDRIRFKVGSYEIQSESKAALDEFGAKVKAMDKGIYLEIQGHTDDTGSAKQNDMLGQQRAEAVRRYLSREFKLPLGRMSTISYGDTAPVESNKNSKGRAKNRRVVIVVLE
jgi:peptidoglycan-associated lipoprotein